MAQNEKIRTEDIIEILDGKILTSEGHPPLSVLPRENYSSVLTKIASQVLSPEQKLAFDSTLTTPSALNPVVLKNDITTYIPQADLGEVKDSVTTFAQLPVPFVAHGSTVLGSIYVEILSTPRPIVRGDSVLSTGYGLQFAAGTKVVDVISSTQIQIYPPATATSTDFTITFLPTDGDLRAVISDGIIYRWNTSSWTPFTRTGTLDHTELINQNGDSNYQHLTQAQKDGLLSNSHSHSNKAVLDGILNAGSGNIITSAERNRLPTTGQKEALIGTSGTPSGSNPYVTHLDPRLNTTRNPYVTVGFPGSLATFQGVDYRPFNDAILAIDIGSASTVKAIEVLSGVYDLSGVSIVWNTQTSSLLIECFTPQTATLSFNGVTGVKVEGTGGALIIRGFTFELNAQNARGILSTRENTIIEDCIFKTGPTVGSNRIGITLSGTGSTIRRCKFIGLLETGVEIKADNCRVESCTFSLTSPTDKAIDIFSGADYALIDHNTITSGIVNIQSGSNFSNITNNIFYSTLNTISDSGTNTRYLENQPAEVNQPFIGGKRTVGLVGTYADYRGSDETPFVSALADPFVTEIEVLEGTYTFTTPVSIPQGKSIRGVCNGDSNVKILGNSGVALFQLSSFSKIENLQLEGSNESLVTSTGNTDIILSHCSFNLTTSSSLSQYEVSLTSNIDCLIEKCSFKGLRGLYFDGSTRAKVLNNVFSNTSLSLMADTSNIKDHIKDNFFITTAAPTIAGSILLVENNHFLGDVPTKLNTTDSIWQGNWPHPRANNDEGVDVLDISLNRYLEPCSSGVERSYIAGTGTLRFVENQIGNSSTLPIYLKAKINKNLPYTVKVFWTCDDGVTGDVIWRVTAVFRDSLLNQIGSFTSNAIISTRTGLLSTLEDIATLSFTSYGITTDPTHVSLIVERVGTDTSDTLNANAHLVEVQVIIPRD